MEPVMDDFARTELNLSQQQVADKLGMTRNGVSNAECKAIRKLRAAVKAEAAAAGVSVRTWLYGED